MAETLTVAGIRDIVAASNQVVVAINNLNQTMAAVFPRLNGVAASATGGAATLPANPVGFLQSSHPVTGAAILIPYYDP